ncbi:MAG: hypothetical protein ACLUTZ_02870 [Oliverpabstia sp.]
MEEYTDLLEIHVLELKNCRKKKMNPELSDGCAFLGAGKSMEKEFLDKGTWAKKTTLR